MPYFIIIWFTIAGVVSRANYYELQKEKQTVRLFEQTDAGYRTYIVLADK